MYKEDFGNYIVDSGRTDLQPWSKLGYNSDIQAASEILSPQGGAYVFPTTGQHMHLKSSNNADKGTAVAGTGIRTLTIYYLDSKYKEKSEVVTLNGTTSVETSATDIFRIQNVRATTTGSSYAAVGNISILNHDENVTYGYIAIGNTRQRQMVWTVPAGKTLYIKHANVYCIHTAANKRCIITMRSTYDDKAKTALTAGLLFMPCAEAILSDNPIPADYFIPKKLPEKTDLKVEAISSGTASVSIALSGYTRKL